VPELRLDERLLLSDAIGATARAAAACGHVGDEVI